MKWLDSFQAHHKPSPGESLTAKMDVEVLLIDQLAFLSPHPSTNQRGYSYWVVTLNGLILGGCGGFALAKILGVEMHRLSASRVEVQ